MVAAAAAVPVVCTSGVAPAAAALAHADMYQQAPGTAGQFQLPDHAHLCTIQPAAMTHQPEPGVSNPAAVCAAGPPAAPAAGPPLPAA